MAEWIKATVLKTVVRDERTVGSNPTVAASGVWRSLVARVLWEHEVAGSTPVTPTSGDWCNGSTVGSGPTN